MHSVFCFVFKLFFLFMSHHSIMSVLLCSSDWLPMQLCLLKEHYRSFYYHYYVKSADCPRILPTTFLEHGVFFSKMASFELLQYFKNKQSVNYHMCMLRTKSARSSVFLSGLPQKIILCDYYLRYFCNTASRFKTQWEKHARGLPPPQNLAEQGKLIQLHLHNVTVSDCKKLNKINCQVTLFWRFSSFMSLM